MSNSASVMRAQRRKKQKAVDYLGGKCQRCGYDRCLDALEFHHKDPSEKEFSPAYVIMRRKWDIAKKELDKCELLCSNCHREEHSKDFDSSLIVQPLKTKTCPQCNKAFMPREGRQKFCSVECAQQSLRKVERPSKQELTKLLKSNSYVAVGNMFGVSDNAIRKWLC